MSDKKLNTEESESENDRSEYLSSIHTCYHRSMFLLRTPLSVCGKPVEIQLCNGNPILICHHSGQELNVTLSSVSRKVALVLLNHGVYHVDTFYYEAVPLFSVVFSSKANLKSFLASSTAQVKNDLESTIGEEFATKLKSSQPAESASKFQPSQPKLTLNIELYLVTPDAKEKGKAEVELVTLANYSHYCSQWQDSQIFEFADVFQTHPHENECVRNQEKVECAELKDLVIELQEVTQWFEVGLHLDIPEAELMHIDHSHRLSKECLKYMLIEWGKRENRTWSKVIRALNAIGMELIAQKLSVKYGTSALIHQTDITTPLPEKADSQSIMIQVDEAKTAEIKHAEEQLKSKQEELKIADRSRDLVKQDISKYTKSLQLLQCQLQIATKEKEDIQVELNEKVARCESLHRMTEHYKKRWIESKELMKDIQDIEIILQEKQKEVMQLQDKLKGTEHELQAKQLALRHLQDDLSLKTTELENKTNEVLELEREVEELRVEFKNKGEIFDMQLQQMVAKISSQDAYIGTLQLHQSSMEKEISVQQEKIAEYQSNMMEKEEKISKLLEQLHSENIQKQKMEEKLKMDVGASASSTADAKDIQLTVIRIDMLRMRAELDEAKKERNQLIIKSDSLKQSIIKLKSMIPDLSKCRAIGSGIESALKHQLCEFRVQVVDADGEPCTGNQDVTIWLVSVEDEVITQTNIVSETSATYVVSFQPRKSGQHMINVKVNGKAIKGSPFRLFVNNIPHPQNCNALGDGVKQAEKYKKSKFMVELADADNEPCATKQVITALLKSLAGSVIKAGVLSKTTATYEVSYQPNKAGQHELHVAVNDIPIKGSPFALLVSNIPDPSHSCKAVGDGVKIAEKGVNAMFLVQLADADGEPCVTEQNVTVALKSTADGLGTNASVVKLTAATYEVTYQPTKSGEYELIVKVNSISIKGSPSKVFVFNVPHPQNCIAVGEGVQQAEKSKKSKFIVQLTDVAGEPCITKQEVTVVLKCLADNAVAKGTVVSKTAAIYEASYQPNKSGEHQLFVEVNGKLINGSPFLLLVSSIPNPQNCKVVGDGVKLAEKNKRTKIIVQLADGDGEPCVTRQEVTVALKSTADGLITNASVAKRVNAAIYEATYQLTRSGTHEIQVKVNSVPIKGSPFPLFVYNIPHPQNCKVLGDGVKQAEKNKESKFTVELADAENELCVTKQEVTTTLKCLADDSATNINLVHITAATYEVSYQPNKAGQHELHVAVNDMPIQGSPFALLVSNVPDPFSNCRAVGEGVTKAVKGINTFVVQLADADGEPCVTEQKVTVALKSMADGLVTKANVVKAAVTRYKANYQPSVEKAAATYKAIYQCTKTGEHELIVKVNSIPIKGSPFKLFVPHPQSCKAVGEGVQQAEKNRTSKFIVQLADSAGEPCITKQEVTVVLKFLADDSVVKVDVVSKTTATYEVSYQPNKAGQHELHVAVNGMPIKGSPFALLVRDGAKTGANRLSRFRSPTQTVGAFGEHKELGTKKGPNRKLRRRSSFLDYRQDRTIQIQGLELFSRNVEARIREKVCRAIEVKYGGQSTQAAISIQRAYRDYKLKKRFEEIRREASQMRKRAESLRADPIRRPSIVQKRRELNGKDPLLLAREASKKLTNRRGGYNSAKKQLVRQLLPEFSNLESSVEITGDMETAVCKVPIGHESDSKENPQKLKFQINSATLDKTSTDPSKEASKPFAFSSDKLYQRHRPSIFTASVSTNNLEELRQQVEQERAMKQRKYSQATIQRKTSIGINHFNRKPTWGIQYLVLESVLEDDPRSVAEFLLKQYSLSKEKIGEFLGEIGNEFNMAVLECLVEMVDLKEKPIDDALRQFQEIFRMPGEAQKIDKIMQAFALGYYRNNPEGAIKSEDGAYMLSFAIMMLHTSLHNPTVQHRTTTQQWVSVNRGCNDGDNFPQPFLLDIYARIKKTEFATGLDHTHVVAQIERQIVGSTLAKLAIPQRHFIYKVSVTEVLDVSVRQGSRARHRRVLFLFSDLVVVCKRKSSDQYIFRESFSLLNALSLTFDTEHYTHGVQIYSSLDRMALFCCNCESATDRIEFLAKLDETIAELCEMQKDGKDFVRGVGDIAVSTSLSQGLLKGTSKSRNRSSGDSGFDSQQTTPVASPSPTGKSQAQAAVLKSPKIALTQPQTPTPPPPTSPTVLSTSLTVSSVATPPRSRSSDHLRSLTITPSSAGLLALPPRAHSIDKEDDTDGTGVRPRWGSAADADVRNLRTSEQEEKKPGKRRGKFPSIPSPFRKRSESRKAGADARVKRTVSQSPPRRENFEVNNRAKSQSPPVPRKTEDGRPISNPDFTTFSHET